MRKLITSSLLLGAFVGGVMSFQHLQIAHAASYKVKKLTDLPPTSYYAKSNKSGYLWNKTHTKRLHNLKNYPRTTWYATGKFSMKSPKNSGTYLKISNGSGKAKGYVWTGYLKKGVNPAYPQGTITDPSGTAMSTYNVDNQLNEQLISLFPGTVPDKSVQRLEDLTYIYHRISDGAYNYAIDVLGETAADELISFSNSDLSLNKKADLLPIAKQEVAAILKKRHLKISDFKGYRIGAYAFPKYSKYYGQYSISLLSPTVTIAPEENSVSPQ